MRFFSFSTVEQRPGAMSPTLPVAKPFAGRRFRRGTAKKIPAQNPQNRFLRPVRAPRLSMTVAQAGRAPHGARPRFPLAHDHDEGRLSVLHDRRGPEKSHAHAATGGARESRCHFAERPVERHRDLRPAMTGRAAPAQRKARKAPFHFVFDLPLRGMRQKNA